MTTPADCVTKRRIVFVRWWDSSQVHGWTKMADVEEDPTPLLECMSVGFELRHTKGKGGALIVVPHVTVQDRPDGTGAMIIPNAAIIEKRVLES